MVCSILKESSNLPATLQAGSSVINCDAFHTCPDFTTCCKHAAGLYTCCPYFRGQCCLDGFHCCPQGYHCDLSSRKCLRNNFLYQFASYEPVTTIMATKVSQRQQGGEE
ncbi:granulins-like [Arapaima gigas]